MRAQRSSFAFRILACEWPVSQQRNQCLYKGFPDIDVTRERLQIGVLEAARGTDGVCCRVHLFLAIGHAGAHR